MALNRVGILTGGGDCSGLNAVIRAVTRAAILNHQAAVVGIEDGFEGLMFNRTRNLDMKEIRDILPQGGTILGASNKGNPFEYREYGADGQIVVKDYSQKVLKNIKGLLLDCLFVVGGDGTLELGHRFQELGVPVIAIPKTIDNDLEGTDYTFGYQTAVQTACDALDRLETTGRSHQRVMILEVMGRHAGWIALESGIAGGAHIILIPEVPFCLDKVVEKIRLRAAGGSPFSIVVVAEGAVEEGGSATVKSEASETLQGVARLGGIGAAIAQSLDRIVDQEVRCTVLGHLQRGGTPTAFDRVLGTRLGAFAVRAAAEGKFGNMVALETPEITLVPLEELAGKVRKVDPAGPLVRCAESIGISLGR